MFFRRRSPDDKLTDAQRERLQIVTVSGQPEGPDRWIAQCRLTFARELYESGRIGRGDEARDER